MSGTKMPVYCKRAPDKMALDGLVSRYDEKPCTVRTVQGFFISGIISSTINKVSFRKADIKKANTRPWGGRQSFVD